MNRRRTPTVVVLAAAALLVAACSGGDSITDSGATTPPTTVEVTAAPGDTTGTTAAPTTTALDLSQFADCPTDALDSATAPVELTFWYGLTGALGQTMQDLIAEYNSSQDKVKINAIEGSYEETYDKYLQSSQGSRPDMMQLPEYTVQSIIDTDSTIPVAKCIQDSGFDTTPYLPTALAAYASQGVQWSMPFNVSNPVLFYNKKVFEAAGLDPAVAPASLEEVRQFSQTIVDKGAATYGIALESGFDSGGGWYMEQFLCKAQEFYVNGENGRAERATQVLFNNQAGVDLLTFLQQMIQDGLAVNVGDNTGTGYDNLLKLADQQQPAAMTIATSASLGPALAAVSGGQFPNIGPDDFGVAPMPGPGGAPGVLVGGASLWIVDKGDPAKAAAAWDFISWLVSAQTQSTFATATGYVPIRSDAADLDPYKTTLADDPRFGVALDQLEATPDVPTSAGPLVGPLREIRSVVATAVAAIFDGADVKAQLDEAANQANNLIADYNSRNSG